MHMSTQVATKEVNEIDVDGSTGLGGRFFGLRNALQQFTRAALGRFFGGGAQVRDIDKECGYPQTAELTPYVYRDLYDRLGLAARVVGVYPDECWALVPELIEDDGQDTHTTFEGAWKELDETLFMNHYMHRIDVISGIGSYGLLVFGFDDGYGFEEPVGGWGGTAKRRLAAGSTNLLYLRAFDESLVQVAEWEEDTNSPRYGLPKAYNLTMFDPNLEEIGGIGQNNRVQKVHWTRCIHVADNRMSSEVFGMPRMQQVYNYLLDYRKTLGGAAEMFYKGGFPGIAFETYPEMGDVEIDRESLDKEMGEYYDTFKKWYATRGMTSKLMNPTVASPEYHVRCQIEAVCIAARVPMRIFIGSEEAKLSSTQDARTWHKRLTGRQTQYINPMIYTPVVNRLVDVGVLPVPTKRPKPLWPDLNTPTDEDRANVASKLTEALVQYVTGGGDSLIDPVDYLTYYHGVPRERAEMMVRKTIARISKGDTFADDKVDRMPLPTAAPPARKAIK
jgi:hypothetical protein